MHTIIVPAMLVALVASWLPAQMSTFANTMTTVGCTLHLAQVDGEIPALDQQKCQAEQSSKARILPAMVQWQNLADL